MAHGSIAVHEPFRFRPGRSDAAAGLPEGPRAAVRAVRRHLHLHQGGRGQLQAQQVALLRPRQDAQPRPPQGLDEAGRLPERHRPHPRRGDREAGGRRAHHLDAVLHPEQGPEERLRLHRHRRLPREGRVRAGREDDLVLAERLHRLGGGDQADGPGDQGRQRRRRPRPQAGRPGEVLPDQDAHHHDPGRGGGHVRPEPRAEPACERRPEAGYRPRTTPPSGSSTATSRGTRSSSNASSRARARATSSSWAIPSRTAGKARKPGRNTSAPSSR